MWKSTSAPGAPDNSSPSHFSAMTRPSWLGRAVMNRHRHAIEQASHRTRRKILISTQTPTPRASPAASSPLTTAWSALLPSRGRRTNAANFSFHASFDRRRQPSDSFGGGRGACGARCCVRCCVRAGVGVARGVRAICLGAGLMLFLGVSAAGRIQYALAAAARPGVATPRSLTGTKTFLDGTRIHAREPAIKTSVPRDTRKSGSRLDPPALVA